MFTYMIQSIVYTYIHTYIHKSYVHTCLDREVWEADICENDLQILIVYTYICGCIQTHTHACMCVCVVCLYAFIFLGMGVCMCVCLPPPPTHTHPGEHAGNRFAIVLRHVTASEAHVRAAVERLQNNGFINYYGHQRFGR